MDSFELDANGTNVQNGANRDHGSNVENGATGGNGANGNAAEHALPPPPPVIPPDVVPLRAEIVPEPVKKKNLRLPIARRGLGTKGQKIPLLTNHFKVNVTNSNKEEHFFHYSVCSLLSFL